MKNSILSMLAMLLCTISCHNAAMVHHSNESDRMGNTTYNYADSVNEGIIFKDTLRGSPVRIIMKDVGDTHIHITYGSPGVRGRIIWGGLVKYDDVWSAGAHNATVVEFNKNVQIDGKTIGAGNYGFFTIPGRASWTLILNKNYKQHLADHYNPQLDVLRYSTQPKYTADTTQRLTYEVNKVADREGLITLKWETVTVQLPFKTFN